jgi:hypothetical protein
MGKGRKRTSMTDKLVNTLVSESGGKRLSAEIYAASDTDYTVNYSINGVLVGVNEFSNTTISAVEENANSWIRGVKILNG